MPRSRVSLNDKSGARYNQERGRFWVKSKEQGESMRIFVSSSFEDLKEHRAAAIRVLRQLGHEVLAMEDMIAGSVAPLAKVVEMVDRSEAYVGVFAWRYGYMPTRAANPPAPAAANIPIVKGATLGETSITHYEYLRAV